jgi:predicted amidohydrolase YtcJ
MRLVTWCTFFFLASCSFKDNEVDLIVHNATIYTVDGAFKIVEAMAIDSGKIVAMGPEREILNKYRSDEVIDAEARFIYPGFIDSHCHFVGYGMSTMEVDLNGTSSWEECLAKVKEYAGSVPSGWITGRGWDQNNWKEKDFPDNVKLSELFPDRPVVLNRVDGHALLANDKALELAMIKALDKVIGGEIISDEKGMMTGLLIDNAMVRMNAMIPEFEAEQLRMAILKAQTDCFQVGLTTVDDAGLDTVKVNLIRKMQKSGELLMRMYVMLEADEAGMEYMKRGIVMEDRLTIRSIKVYADGALGSRGAALKEDYHDHPGHKGTLLHQPVYFKQWAALCDLYGFQMNTHCIGDRANQLMLSVYNDQLSGANDKRWRIEHAQVLTGNDLDRFKTYSILPSIQPTHATSDMTWAEDRLGPERISGAYSYASLLKQNGIVLLGTDFPIEGIDPLDTFYAAVFRKDKSGSPENGWRSEEVLSREQALMGITIWGAIGNFEEDRKGSLEKGKLADFVILDRDLMKCDEKDVLKTKVMATYVGGQKVY